MSENIAPAPKKRGRPAGSVREIYFVIATVQSGSLYQEKIQVTRAAEFDMRLEAISIYKEQYPNAMIEDENILGPFFEAKLVQSTPTIKRESVKFSDDLIDLTNRKIQADFGNWRVLGRYFINEDGSPNEEYVRITFRSELVPGDKPKSPPRDTFKALTELTNIVEVKSVRAAE